METKVSKQQCFVGRQNYAWASKTAKWNDFIFHVDVVVPVLEKDSLYNLKKNKNKKRKSINSMSKWRKYIVSLRHVHQNSVGGGISSFDYFIRIFYFLFSSIHIVFFSKGVEIVLFLFAKNNIFFILLTIFRIKRQDR